MGDTRQGRDETGAPIPALQVGSVLGDPITVGSASVQSDAIAALGSSGSRVLALYYKSTDGECHIAVGVNPTASTSDRPLPANVETYVVVDDAEKLAVIRGSTDNAQNGGSGGTLFVTQI